MHLFKILQELNLDHLFSKFQANQVEIDTFKQVSIKNGSIRLRPQLQQILMLNCGLNTGQITKILEKIKSLPLSHQMPQSNQMYAQANHISQPAVQFNGSKVGNKRLSALMGAPKPPLRQTPHFSQLQVKNLAKPAAITEVILVEQPPVLQHAPVMQAKPQQPYLPIVQKNFVDYQKDQVQQLVKQLVEEPKIVEPIEPKLEQKAPKFKSPPVKEMVRTGRVLMSETLDKCNPLKSMNSLNFINDKLAAHRQAIIDQYGSSKVPTPSAMSIISQKQSPPAFFNMPKDEVKEFDFDYPQPMIALDDELSQVAQPFQQPYVHQPQIQEEFQNCPQAYFEPIEEPKSQSFQQEIEEKTPVKSNFDIFDMFTQSRQQNLAFESPLEPRSQTNHAFDMKPIQMPIDLKITPENYNKQPVVVDDQSSYSYAEQDESESDYEGTHFDPAQKDFIEDNSCSEEENEQTFQNTSTAQLVAQAAQELTPQKSESEDEPIQNDDEIMFKGRSGSQQLWQTGKQLSIEKEDPISSSSSDQESENDNFVQKSLSFNDLMPKRLVADKVQMIQQQSNRSNDFEMVDQTDSEESDQQMPEKSYEATAPFNPTMSEDESEGTFFEIIKPADKLTQEEIRIEMENLPVIEVSYDAAVQTDHVQPVIVFQAPEVPLVQKSLLVEQAVQWSPQLSPKKMLPIEIPQELNTPALAVKMFQELETPTKQVEFVKSISEATISETPAELIIAKVEPEKQRKQEFQLFKNVIVEPEQFISKVESEVLLTKPASVTKQIDLTSPMPSKPKAVLNTDVTKQISLFSEYKSPSEVPKVMRTRAMQSPTPRTQDSDAPSPNTKQQIQMLNRPMTSRFTTLTSQRKFSPVKAPQTRQRKSVQFEDLRFLTESDKEHQLENEELIYQKKIGERKALERKRLEKIKQKKAAIEQKNSQRAPERITERHPERRQKNRRYKESSEEEQEEQPQVKRQKLHQAEAAAAAIRGNFNQFSVPAPKINSIPMSDAVLQRLAMYK